MKLLLQRKPSTTCAIGDLFIDGIFQCHTLEDVVREVPGKPISEWKIPGKTAIPAGRYQILITHSPRFKRFLPHLQNVPGFEGVRIHPGNTDADTEGCILPGRWDGKDRVLESKSAYAALVLRLDAALKRDQKIYIEVRNAPIP